VPDLIGVSPLVNAIAVACALGALPWFAGLRWKTLADKNNLAGAFLLSLAVFLHGGFGTLLKCSPTAVFTGCNLLQSNDEAVDAYVLIAAPRSPSAQRFHIRWSPANRLPTSFWDPGALLKCRYRVWDREITHISAVPTRPTAADTAWEWNSNSGSLLWCSLEGIGGLALLLLCARAFRRASRRAREVVTGGSARRFPNQCVRVVYPMPFAVVGGWAAYVTCSDWLFERKAEALLERIQALRLRESTWKDAEAIRRNFARDADKHRACSPPDCEVMVTLTHEPLVEGAPGEILSKMLRLAGGRWGYIEASVRVRNGIVWGKDVRVGAEAPGVRPPWGFSAEAGTVRGFDLNRDEPVLHLNIEFGARAGAGHFNRRVRVTPYASAEEMREAFAFDL